jgi:hypothetical protein
MKKIAWLLSLVLCLGVLLSSLPAQADEIGKEVTQFKVQGGELVSDTGTNSNARTLLEGTGERKFSTHVNFPEPYQEPPVVVLSLSGLDVLNNANNRVTVKPINITQKGFDVEYKTWGDTKIQSVFLNWTSFGGRA